MVRGDSISPPKVDDADAAPLQTFFPARDLGTRGRIDVAADCWKPSTIAAFDQDGVQTSAFDGRSPGSGYQFEAFEVERLIASGATESELLPLDETVAMMKAVVEIRRQVGLIYPGER